MEFLSLEFCLTFLVLSDSLPPILSSALLFNFSRFLIKLTRSFCTYVVFYCWVIYWFATYPKFDLFAFWLLFFLLELDEDPKFGLATLWDRLLEVEGTTI